MWRGQADKEWELTSGMHYRVKQYLNKHPDEPHDTDSFNDRVTKNTVKLLKYAREFGFDQQGSSHLPDLALLAKLQHYGAATPLLDVTTNPEIALWMLSSDEHYEKKDGALYGIFVPKDEQRHTTPWDVRDFRTLYNQEPDYRYCWYSAPFVSERLRIQDGSFIYGKYKVSQSNTTSLNLEIGDSSFVTDRIDGYLKQQSPRRRHNTEMFRIIIPAYIKKPLAKVLEQRFFLTDKTVLPSPLEQVTITDFAEQFGRNREIFS